MDEIFTKEALKSQDGKKLPVTKYPGGPVIGECVLKWNEAEGRLDMESVIFDSEMTAFLREPPSHISGEEQ